MKYHLDDKFLLAGVECSVGLVNANGHAYLFPDTDGDTYDNSKTLVGLSFAIVNEKGKDKLGNKVTSLVGHDCGAV